MGTQYKGLSLLNCSLSPTYHRPVIALEAGEDVAAVFKREAVKRWVPLSVDETVRRQVARTKMELDRGAHSLDVRVRDPLAAPSKSSRRRSRDRKVKRRSGGN